MTKIYKNEFNNYDQKKTTMLFLEDEEISEIGNEICDFKNLREIYLSKNKLTLLPDEIYKLKKLKYLNVSNNSMYFLSEKISKLSKLKFLDLSKNCIKNIPNLCSLKNLKILNLGQNKLKECVLSFFTLYNLEELLLNDNKLKNIKFKKNQNSKLKILNLKNNKLKNINKDILKFRYLKKLNLSGNKIRSINIICDNFINLKNLYICHNKLTSLPDDIRKLTSLKILDISENIISYLPSTIRNLSNLKELHIKSNCLIRLPQTIGHLKNSLVFIDCTKNCLLENDERDQIGKISLLKIFYNKILFDNTNKENLNKNIEEIFDELKNKKYVWNFEKLVKCKVKSVPIKKFTKNKIYEMWNLTLYKKTYNYKFDKLINFLNDKQNRKKIIPDINFKTNDLLIYLIENDEIKIFDKYYNEILKIHKNKIILEQFIEHLFDSRKPYKKWKIPVEYIKLSVSLLGLIFEMLLINNDELTVTSHINNICEGLKFCADRQISELLFSYNILNNVPNEDETLENIILNFIAHLKQRVLQNIVTPASSQNVHVLIFWINEIGFFLGVDCEYPGELGTMDQDEYMGRKNNVLNDFFSIFTPEYVGHELLDYLNSKNKFLCKVAEWIFHNKIIDASFFNSKTEEITELESINIKFCIYMLINMNLINKNF